MLTETKGAGTNDNGGSPAAMVPAWTPRQVFAATLVILAVIAGFWLLFRFRLVVFGLFEAIVFATALRPLVDWLQRRGIPRALGAAGVFVLVALLLVGLGLLFVPLFTTQGSSIATTLQTYYHDFRQALLSSPSILITRLALQLPASLAIGPAAAVPANPANPATPLNGVGTAIGFLMAAIHGIFVTTMTLLLTYYWTIDRERIVRSSLSFLPAARREDTRLFIEASEEKVGAYLRGLAIMCATIGGLSFVAYLIIGLPNLVLLAVLAGLFEAVPLIGPILGAIPAVLMALALDPTRVLWVIVATIVIQQFENHILVPRVMNQSVGVNPVVSLLAFVIFSSLFGLAGALLAIPLAATLQLIFNRAIVEAPEPPVGRDTISVLRYEAQQLIQDVRKQVREKDTLLIDDPTDQVEDAIESIVNDLDSILAKAEQDKLKDTQEEASRA